MLTQLDPPIPLDVIGKGHGLAVAVTDYGPDFDLLWVVILNDGGEVWTESNKNVRGVVNHTLGRVKTEQAT